MIDKSVALEFEKPIIELEERIASLQASAQDGKMDFSAELRVLEQKCQDLKNEIYGSLKPWQRIQLARHPRRPYTLDYVKAIFNDFIELHGDRAFGDDKAMVCGFAVLDGNPVAVLGQQKGRNIQENLERNFASAHPEGYRKAMRIMKLAEKFKRPIVTFIDTQGAYPGIAAEERGQAEAIARNLRDMSDLKVPVVSIVIGEGGSGGALGIGIANRLLMLENSYYSVISPEGCAAILFRDASKAKEAAEALKITASDLHKAGVVDEIIPEPLGGAHNDPAATAGSMKSILLRHLAELSKMSENKLRDDRYSKYRNIGVFHETAAVKDEHKKRKSKTSPQK